jgi:GT2 family glycosyltransferase
MWTMTDPSEITVVIPTRNRRQLLAETLDSLKRQEGVLWEAVVVDDDSSDDTWSWLQELSDPRIRVRRQGSRQRQSAARNRALKEVRTRYCLFLDDDDLLWPQALRILSQGLTRTPHAVAAIGARQDWFTAQGYRRRDVHPLIPRVVDLTWPLLAGWSAVPGQVLFRTELLHALGGYDPSVVPCEDRDLLQRVAQYGPLLLRPETVMTYRITPQQWRPPDIRKIRERVARRMIHNLPKQQRRSALRVRYLVAFVDKAEDQICQGSLRQTIWLLTQAALASSATLLSPLTGPWLLRRLAGRLARRVLPPHQLQSPP